MAPIDLPVEWLCLSLGENGNHQLIPGIAGKMKRLEFESRMCMQDVTS